jgi:hypothetical protein
MIPAGMMHFKGLHGTEMPALDASEKPALPFAQDAPAATEEAYQRAREHGEATEPERAESAPAGPVAGETRDISSIVAAVLAKKAATPFDKQAAATASAPAAAPLPAPVPASAPPDPALTLEQYASLCVELTLAPANAREITQRYGLSDEGRARVDAYWRGRIANEPEVDNAFRWAYHSYQQWIAQR